MRRIDSHSSLIRVLEAHSRSALIAMDLKATWTALGSCLFVLLEDVTILTDLIVNFFHYSVSIYHVTIFVGG